MNHSDVWQIVRSSVEEVRSIANDVTVAVVANLKSSTPAQDDYKGTSVTTEYFSENEASQILLGLSENGFYTKLYVGEIEFIDAVLQHSFYALPRARKLVYNVAQSGTGPGRKSLIPAFCALTAIAICNSDSYVVSLARNKYHVQCILSSLGIAVPESWQFDAERGWLLGRRPPVDMRLIAKASYESASIGLTKESIGEISSSYESFLQSRSATLRQPLVVQRFIHGYEVEVPVMDFGFGPSALEPVVITLQGDAALGERILDYEIVERDDFGFSSSTVLDSNVVAQLREQAASVFTAIGIRSVGRVDFRVASVSGPIYVTDIATSPHVVQHSSFAFNFHQAGLSHSDLMGAVIAANASRHGWY
jgi:D-alanine-D-alanine ligase